MSSVAEKRKLFDLFSVESLSLLRRALNLAAETGVAVSASGQPSSRGGGKSRFADSSSSENEGNHSYSSSSSSEDDEEEERSDGGAAEQTDKAGVGPPAASREEQSLPKIERKHKKRTKTEMNEHQRIAAVNKHFDSLSCISLRLGDPDESGLTRFLDVPLSLCPKKVGHNPVAETESESFIRFILNLSESLQKQPVLVVSLRSGRLAAAVFRCDVCLLHTTSTRYTVRKGQGKAQSAQDGQRRPKSIGSQLRRAGEQALQEDVASMLLDWKEHVDSAALILLSVPKTMLKTIWEANVVQKDDSRIRKVPLDLGRPTFENVRMIHSVMMTVKVQHRKEEEINDHQLPEEEAPSPSPDVTKKTESVIVEETNTQFPDLTDLHIAARDGDVEKVRSILSSLSETTGNSIMASLDVVNSLAGPYFMTPLHYAAESAAQNCVEPVAAAECTSLLFEVGHANPCIVDSRNRPPYFLAAHERVRDAFRMARASLGEEYCQWDDGAKVGPPLTLDDIQAKKEKEAEKRRKKKARQKEKKLKERALVEEAEQERLKEEERRKQEAEAKRIRDGLAPKVQSSTGGVCDFCQTVCKGRKRSQMFKRLEYAYCSSECVQKHKRELMAAAALKRFGDS